MCGKVFIKYFDTFTRFSSDIKLNESFKVSSFNWSFCFTMIFFFYLKFTWNFFPFFTHVRRGLHPTTFLNGEITSD